MQFTPKKSIKRFQQGGPMMQDAAPMEEEMPAEGTPTAEAPTEEPQNPLLMLAEGAVQALQNQDCQIAMQVCQGLLQVLQSAQQAAPTEPAGEPVFRKGGVLIKRIRK